MGRKKKTGKNAYRTTAAERLAKELADRKKKGLSLLAKFGSESVKEHRAFLLWAMQTPPTKSLIAKIFDITSAGVNYWSKRYYWSERRQESPTIAVECQALYRELYYETMGESEVKQLGMWLETPVSNIPVNQDIVDKVRDIVKNSPADPRTLNEKKIRTRHLSALDAAIAYLMQGIKDGSIRRNLRDLPILIQLREEMSEDRKGQAAAMIVESVRVRNAKAANGNVVEAMYEDALELTMILKNLKSSGEGYEAIHGQDQEETN